MNSRTIFLICVIAVLAAAAGWLAAKKSTSPSGATNAAPGERKVLFYQSAMHPWIKSDKPGNCTICGMKLTPVYEGEKGIETSADIVMLPKNSITVLNVQTAEVRRQPLERTLRVAGRIDDNDTRHRFVSAYIDGRIDELAVNHVGAEVVEGQPLATFYSPQLLTAEREYLTLRRGLVAQNGEASLTPEQQSMLTAAAQRLKRLGLTDAQIEQLEDKGELETHTEIRAPVSGTVVARFVYAGQYVKEGDKIFEIADFSTMWFLFDAYERDLAWLKPGQMVSVTTPSVPGKTFEAPITFIDPNFNETTRSTRVRVELANPIREENGRPRRELLHRLYAEGVVKAQSPEVLAVPRPAVLSPGSQPVVYVDLGDGNYQQRKVRLGRAGDNVWEVLEGVTEGERVVTSGNLLIDAQAQINHHTSEPSSTGNGKDNSPATEAIPASSTSLPNEQGALPLEKISETQVKSARDLIAAIDEVNKALSADNLPGFNQSTKALHTALPALVEAFKGNLGWSGVVNKLNTVGHLSTATDLKAARKAFHPLSTAAVEFASLLRKQDTSFNSVKIFQCPMTNRSFPGAPRTAQWLQLGGEIRNPYFGADMLDCGTEVKP